MYFIAGMPRCRTKWFAEYLSAYPGVDFRHEALNGILTKQAFYDLMETGIGNSDSGLCLTDFQERWPDAPTVILLRDPQMCRRSLHRALGIDPSIDLLREQYAAAKTMKGLHVRYEDIDARIEEIHNHLGIEFDAEIHKAYKERNIQLEELKVCLDSYLLWTDLRRENHGMGCSSR
jgi:hypothetical protein